MIKQSKPADAYPTLGALWDYAMDIGVEMGYRDARTVWDVCRRHRQRYDRMRRAAQRRFDKTRLTVPFGDCRVYAGRRSDKIHGVLATIDAMPDAALQINQLNLQGWNIDLLFAHHGGSREMMYTAEDYLSLDAPSLARTYSLPASLMKPLAVEAHNRALSKHPDRNPKTRANWRFRYMRVSGTAERCRQINVAHVNVHTPCDAVVWRAVWDVVNEAAGGTCQDAIDGLYRIPEFRRYRQQAQMRITMPAGGPGNKLGRWWNATCAATLNLTEQSLRALKAAGFDTLIGIFTECEMEKLLGLNVISLPHDPTDAIGINGMLDCFAERWPALDILGYGKFVRVERRHPRAWTEAVN